MNMLKDELAKLFGGKAPKSNMSEQELQAKLDVLRELLDLAQSEMGGRVKGGMDEMRKVSVMAPDQEGLKEGLQAAEKIVQEPMLEEAEEATGMEMDDDNEISESALHKDKMGEEENKESIETMSKEDQLASLAGKPKRKLFSMEDDEDEEEY